MKKTLYFEPPKKSIPPEYIIIVGGKIREAAILQLIDEIPEIALNLARQIEPHNDEGFKDMYAPLKNINVPVKLIKIDRYIRKRDKLKYNYRLLVISPEDYNNFDPDKTPSLWPAFTIQNFFRNRTANIYLNFAEKLLIDYHLFSWSETDTNTKIRILSIIIASIISITTIALKIFDVI